MLHCCIIPWVGYPRYQRKPIIYVGGVYVCSWVATITTNKLQVVKIRKKLNVAAHA